MHFLHKSTSALCTALVFGSVDTDEAGDHPQVRPTCVRTWKAKDTPLNFITQPHRDNIISWNHTISYLRVQRQFTRFKLYRVISKLLMRMICIWRVIIHTDSGLPKFHFCLQFFGNQNWCHQHQHHGYTSTNKSCGGDGSHGHQQKWRRRQPWRQNWCNLAPYVTAHTGCLVANKNLAKSDMDSFRRK